MATVRTIGSLFSGIGGLELGLERALGARTIWQVECDKYALKVLEKHWPDVPRYTDIRTVGGVVADAKHQSDAPSRGQRAAVTGQGASRGDDRGRGQRDAARRQESLRGAGQDTGPHILAPVDLICGGFPCQPHSQAGARKGGDDERDLWSEFVRIIGELRPRWVVAENVPGLLSSRDGLGAPAGSFFRRVLYDLAAIGYDAEWESVPAVALGAPHLRYRVFIVAYPDGSSQVSDTAGTGPSDGGSRQVFGPEALEQLERCRSDSSLWWAIEPQLGRVAHGIPKRVDRLRCLGNAVVPAVAEYIGRVIAAR